MSSQLQLSSRALRSLDLLFISDGEIYFSKKYEMATFKKMENVNFIFNLFTPPALRIC